MTGKIKKVTSLFPLLVLSLGSICTTLILLEIGMRLIDYNYPLVSQHDPYAGYSNRPNISGWVDNESVEQVTTDRFAFRVDGNDPGRIPHTVDKPANEFRIAILGDSFTESFHVSYAQSFPVVLESLLQTCAPTGRKVRVQNFAVAGYSTVQELMSFRHRARLYAPDLVLLMFNAGNDLRNNYRKLENYPYAPYAEFRDGKLHIDETFRLEPGFLNKLTWANVGNDLANRSRVAQAVVYKIGRALQMRWHNRRLEVWNWEKKRGTTDAPVRVVPGTSKVGSRPETAKLQDDLKAEFDKFFADDFTPPGVPRVNPEFAAPESVFDKMLWQLAEEVLLQISDEVGQSGAEFWLSSTATHTAIHRNPEERKRAAKALGIDEEFDYATRRFEKFAERNGFNFVPLTGSLRSFAVTKNVDFHFHRHKNVHVGHWNSDGHAVVAETLSKRLCSAVSR